MRIFRRTKEHIGLETLSEYLDRRLASDKVAWVEGHLETCSGCREELDSLRHTVQLLRRVPELAPSRVVTLAEAPEARPAAWGVRVPTWAYGAAASVAILVFAVILSTDLSGVLSGDVSRPDELSRAVSVPDAPPQAKEPLPTDLPPSTTAPPEPAEGAELAASAPAEDTVEEDTVPSRESLAMAAPAPTPSPQPVAAAAAQTEQAAVAASVPKKTASEDTDAKVADAPDSRLQAADVGAAMDIEAVETPGSRLEAAAPISAEAMIPTAIPEAARAEATAVPSVTATPAPAVAPPPAVEPSEAGPAEASEFAPQEYATPQPEPALVPVRGTALVWRILEGVLGGVGLLLAGGVIWRMRFIRRRGVY